jgi:hypothetical protein
MCKASYAAGLLGLTLCTPLPDKTAAQDYDASGVVYEAARNKIGLMRYCRNNALLHPGIADKAAELIEADLRPSQLDGRPAKADGDRAEAAGQDGFLDAGRRRDIASFAERFKTTNSGLCKQWAEDALRPRQTNPAIQALSVTVMEPARANPAGAQPQPSLDGSAAPNPAPRRARMPPLPTKAPSGPDAGKIVHAQQVMPTAARMPSNPPYASKAVVPVSAPSGKAVAAEPPAPPRNAPARKRYGSGPPYTLLEKWPTLSLGKLFNLD